MWFEVTCLLSVLVWFLWKQNIVVSEFQRSLLSASQLCDKTAGVYLPLFWQNQAKGESLLVFGLATHKLRSCRRISRSGNNKRQVLGWE